MKATSVPMAALTLVAATLTSACEDELPDAYGNFEATEVVVSAEVSGQIVDLLAAEGERLPSGATAAWIDTVALSLRREELAAQRAAARVRIAEARAQIRVLQAQLGTARDEHERTVRLFEAEAATAARLNRTRGEVRVLAERIAAAEARLGVASEEAGGVDARMRQVEERLEKSRVTNPISGTVLTTYAEAGEYVRVGQPIYRIANLQSLTLRAYLSGPQLAQVRLGQDVVVRFDEGRGLSSRPGRLTWIAAEAEFTPTPIQTREERADHVYAIKVRVPNPDGVIKIGMPGDVVLPPEGRSSDSSTGPGEGSNGEMTPG